MIAQQSRLWPDCRLEDVPIKTLMDPAQEQASNVRTLLFDGSGRFLLATTDAKTGFVWQCSDWSLRYTLCVWGGQRAW